MDNRIGSGCLHHVPRFSPTGDSVIEFCPRSIKTEESRQKFCQEFRQRPTAAWLGQVHPIARSKRRLSPEIHTNPALFHPEVPDLLRVHARPAILLRDAALSHPARRLCLPPARFTRQQEANAALTGSSIDPSPCPNPEYCNWSRSETPGCSSYDTRTTPPGTDPAPDRSKNSATRYRRPPNIRDNPAPHPIHW